MDALKNDVVDENKLKEKKENNEKDEEKEKKEIKKEEKIINNRNPELMGNRNNHNHVENQRNQIDNKQEIKKKLNSGKIVIILSVIVLVISVLISVALKIKNNYFSENSNSYTKSSGISAIIGLDFGSTTSGYSILFDSIEDLTNSDNQDLFDSKIIIHKFSEEALFIGIKAKQYFEGNPNNKENLYFTRFKRNLDPKINKNMVASDFPGDEINLEIILKEFLRKIRIEAEERNSRIENVNLKELKWIMTVPPLWDIKGKNLIEKAAKKAGMANLGVILEPEAASLAIFNENNPIIKKFIEKDKKFLIVDAGGYTVDFSANKILENNNLEQLIIPTSIVNGSSLINDKIFELFEKFIGEDKIKDFDYSYIKKIWDGIEEHKKEVDYNTAGNYKIDIRQFNVICKSEGYIAGAISWVTGSENYCVKEIEGKNLTYNNEDLFIPNEYITEIITKTSKTIINYINHVLSKIGAVDLIVFTGGFSNNKIFRKYLEEYKEGGVAEIAYMKEPQKTVMNGAALYGLYPTQIIKRIIPITIGVDTYEKKENNTICDDAIPIDNNEVLCHKYLRFTKKRTSIETNQIINHEIYQINDRIVIYYNYDDDITDENKHELGFLDFPIDEQPRRINITMKFSNYINVTVIDNNLGEKYSTLLSYPVNKFL